MSKNNTQALQIKQLKGESDDQALARYALMPEMQSALTILHTTNNNFCYQSIDNNALVDELNHQTEQVKKKDLSSTDESMVRLREILAN